MAIVLDKFQSDWWQDFPKDIRRPWDVMEEDINDRFKDKDYYSIGNLLGMVDGIKTLGSKAI